jgi:hypothetical protein
VIGVEIGVFFVGAFCVAATLGSGVRTVILPRAVPSRITRRVFRVMRALFDLRVGPRAPFERRDRILALYAPLSLLVLILTWELILLGGYTAMFWANGVRPWPEAFHFSGSSLLTLGFDRPPDIPNSALAFSEAAFGLLILALLIAYLPTIYGLFSRREQFVTFLEVRADSPPSSSMMLRRFWILGRPDDRLEDLWQRAETWFADLAESHVSFPALVFFRSPEPEHSWVTAAGTVLDAASLVASTIDRPRDPDTELCIRSGFLALRRIASFFGIAFDPDPAPTDPISITREEYNRVCAELEGSGVPLKADRDQAWRNFAGWRVNYDAVLLGLALLTAAPYAQWSSDRSPPGARRGLALTRKRSRARM